MLNSDTVCPWKSFWVWYLIILIKFMFKPALIPWASKLEIYDWVNFGFWIKYVILMEY